MRLINYQQELEWMGSPVLTLADLWPHTLRGMVVGRYPSPASVQSGRYYQALEPKTALDVVLRAGLLASFDDLEQQALDASLGFTHLIKRSVSTDDEIGEEELAYGRDRLVRRLERRRVPIVVCGHEMVLHALTGQATAVGWADSNTSWEGRVFHVGEGAPVEELRDALR